jgi:hypothetical protein
VKPALNPRLARAMPLVAIGAAVIAVGLATAAVIKTRLAGGGGREAAPVNIEKWTAAWHAARGCLVGSPQASPDLAEAIGARDLVTPEAESCARQIVDLRGVTPDGGPAWVELQRHIGTLAEAYTAHRVRLAAPLTDRPADDPLGISIGTLDTAGARLRKAAGLPPADLAAPAALPVLAGTLLLHEGMPLYLIDLMGGHLVVRDSTTGDYATVYFFPGQLRLEVGAYVGGNVWSTDGTWKLSTATRGDNRTLYADPPQKRLAAGSMDELLPIAALGRDLTRFALYYDKGTRYLARSTDGGETWDKQKVPGDYGWLYAASATGGRLDMGYWDEDGFWVQSLSVTQNASGRLPAPIRVARGEASTSCETGALWLVLSDGGEYVVRRADSGEIARFRDPPQIRACSGEHALIVVDEVERLCSTTECRIVPTARSAGAGFVGETLVRHATQGELVALWKDFGDPTFVRTPRGRVFVGVIEREGTGYAVLRTEAEDAVELAPLP